LIPKYEILWGDIPDFFQILYPLLFCAFFIGLAAAYVFFYGEFLFVQESAHRTFT